MIRKKGAVFAAYLMILLMLAGAVGCGSAGSGPTAGGSSAEAGSGSSSAGTDSTASESSGGTGVVTTAGSAQAVDQGVIAEAVEAARAELEAGKDWSEETFTASITLSGNSASVNGQGVQVDETTVTITQGGTYLVEGSLDDGTLVVDTDKDTEVRLILNGVNITCSDSAPLNGRLAGKLTVTLAEGSENILTDGSAYTYDDAEKEEPNAALFCKNDLVINGTGSLTVNASFNHGINAKDMLVITGASCTVNSANDGIRGKDAVIILGSSCTVTAASDGIKSSNDTDNDSGWIYLEESDFDIQAEGDGIQAETVLTAESGTFRITAGGGSENAAAHTDAGGFGEKSGARDPNGFGGKGYFGGRGQMGGEMPSMPDGAEVPSMPDGAEVPEMPENGEILMKPENGEMPEVSDDDLEPAALEISSDTDAVETEENEVEADTDASDSKKAMKAGLLLEVKGGTGTIDSADDGFHSNGDISVSGGSFTIKTGDDGIHADGTLSISGGILVIEESYEGLEGQVVELSGGEAAVTASDDGVNAAGETMSACRLVITGGTLHVNARGDGLDSNGDIEMTGGEVYVSGPTDSGNGSLDYGTGCRVDGGTLVLAGNQGMLQTPDSSSAQNSVTVLYSQTQAAGTEASLRDADGNVVISWAPDKEYQSISFSAAGIETGKMYSLYSGQEKLCDIDVTDTVTVVDDTGAASAGGMGGSGGMRAPGAGRKMQ